MKAILAIVLTALAATSSAACVSGSGDDTSPDASSSGSTGGAGGKADDGTWGTAVGGSAGEQLDADLVEDSNPTIALPSSCAPTDMRFLCNPMTNEGCKVGETCDYGLDEYFACTQIETTAGEGSLCNAHEGPFCYAGWTCDTPSDTQDVGVCRHHCCSSADCPSPQTCQTFDPEFGSLGICR